MNAIHRRLSRHLLPLLLLPLALALPTSAGTFHSLDTTQDGRIDLDELLRAIQLYNSLQYHCAAGTEDGFDVGPGDDSCIYNDLDYAPADWRVSIDELLRAIQFYNLPGIVRSVGTEDGFGAGQTLFQDPNQAFEFFEALDKDRDRRLTREEAAPAFAAPSVFDKLDVNADGALSRFEFLIHSQGQLTKPVDTAAPTITLNAPASISVTCGETYTAPDIAAFDADEGNITPYIQSEGVFEVFNEVGTHIIRYSVTDRACNTTSVTQTVDVLESAEPTITVLGGNPYTLSCGYSFYDPGATAVSQCTATKLSVISDTSAVDTTSPGDYVVRYTATSDNGQFIATAERIVQVIDNTPPDLYLLGNEQVVLAEGSAWIDPGARADDTCDGRLIVDSTAAPDTATPGDYTITYTAMDSSGNVSTATRRVHVYSLENPLKALDVTIDATLNLNMDDAYINDSGVRVLTNPAPVVQAGSLRYFYQNTNVEIELDCSPTTYCDYWCCGYPISTCGIDISVDGALVSNANCGFASTITMDADRSLELMVYLDTTCGGKMDEKWPCPFKDAVPDATPTWNSSVSMVGEKDHNTDGFADAATFPTSAFPTITQTESFDAARARILNNQLPASTEINPDEFLNHFAYRTPAPTGNAPFGYGAQVFDCPWNAGHRLLKVTIQTPGYTSIAPPTSATVFVIQKMPAELLALVKTALQYLITQSLSSGDHVGIILSFSEALKITACSPQNLASLNSAIDDIGSTVVDTYVSTSAALTLMGKAPDVDIERIIFIANDLPTLQAAPRANLEEAAATGITSSVVAVQPFDSRIDVMKNYATAGSGRFSRTATVSDIHRRLASECKSANDTVATKVSANIEFNPSFISQYRRVTGAGSSTKNDEFPPLSELRQGDTFTALYEIVPVPSATSPLDTAAIVDIDNWPIDCAHPRALSFTVPNVIESPASADAQFAAGVATLALALSDSPFRGTATLDMARDLATAGLDFDPYGERLELMGLINTALTLSK